MLQGIFILALALTLAAPAFSAEPGGDGGIISIMRPEPRLSAPKHPSAHKRKAHRRAKEPQGYGVKEDTRRGSSSPVYPAPLPGPQAPRPVPHGQALAPRGQDVPPALLVPQTGRLLPNLPPPGGTETSQDRSARCAHQAGVYGPALTGDPGAYIRSCINQ